MFDTIGWGEIVVLALAALMIFGPERLPHLAKDASAGIRAVRSAVSGARGQLHDSLRPDVDGLHDVDLRQYHPRTLLRRHLLTADADLRDDPAGSALDDNAVPATSISRRVRWVPLVAGPQSADDSGGAPTA